MGIQDDIPPMSQPTLKVLHAFLEDPGRTLSGADLHQRCAVGPATLYPILLRLETAGWLTSQWETMVPSSAVRPRSRLYRLTSTGLRHAGDVFASSHRGVFA